MERELLHRFYAGTATPEEEREVCGWVDASEENRRVFMEERRLFDLLLLNAPEESALGQTRRGARIALGVLKVAASVAVLTASALWTYSYLHPSAAEVSPIVAQPNRITVPAGQRVNLTLSDGTSVWLNACSELAYPASFGGGERQVSLTGEAYFEVSKNTGHPFVVQTAACDVKVVGTKFNVQADSVGTFSTALLEGAVELREKGQGSRVTRLLPLQKATLTASGLAVDTLLSLDDYRWREGLVCADNLRFGELMQRFERTYGLRIEVRNAALAARRYSGKFRTSDGIDFILQVLQRSMPFRFTRTDNENTIIIQ